MTLSCRKRTGSWRAEPGFARAQPKNRLRVRGVKEGAHGGTWVPPCPGGGALDTKLMQTLPGWTAKGGAEGLLCAAAPDRLGLALKVEDGNGRALQPALGVFLAGLGFDGAPFGPADVRNSRDDVVGEVEEL